MVKIVEAFRFGVEEPPVWLAWCGTHWHEYSALGEQKGCEGVVLLVAARTPWNQSMRQRGPVRR